uniref:Uncharacterized protein n=1 Tax=Rhizophora mucronata TaxID=61149 RepID=A0A2P2NXH2_RHIMU
MSANVRRICGQEALSVFICSKICITAIWG